LVPKTDWSVAKPFCQAFAEMMAQEEPTRFLAHLKIADRRGRILIDWLRNGLGATAVASFSPRAGSGATVATPVSWTEVTPKLDPSRHTVLTVPERLAKLNTDPWEGFDGIEQRLPDFAPKGPRVTPAPKAADVADPPPARRSRIVIASKPKPRRVDLEGSKSSEGLLLRAEVGERLRDPPDRPDLTPFGRPGQPAELGSIYVQLAANDASFATGQVYGASGGNGQP
jgi:LigD, primase-polymerase domain